MSEISHNIPSEVASEEHFQDHTIEDSNNLDARLDEVRFALGALRDAYESGTLTTEAYDTPKSPFIDQVWFENNLTFQVGQNKLVLGLDKDQSHEISHVARRREIITMIAEAYKRHHAMKKAVAAWGDPLTSRRREIKRLPYEYVREMISYPVLSEDEQGALFEKIEDGFALYTSLDSTQDLSQEIHEVFAGVAIARLLLSLSHARMVIDMTKDLTKGRKRMPAGLVRSGNGELLRAIDEYQLSCERPFQEVAKPQIGQTMWEFLESLSREVPLTRSHSRVVRETTRPQRKPQDDLESKIRTALGGGGLRILTGSDFHKGSRGGGLHGRKKTMEELIEEMNRNDKSL